MSLKWLWLFFWLTGPTNQSRPIADLVNFYVFSTIWIEFSMWTANAPALLLLLPCYCIAPGLLLACSQPAPGLPMVCSCPAPGPAHPSLAVFISSSTLRLIFGTAIAAFYGSRVYGLIFKGVKTGNGAEKKHGRKTGNRKEESGSENLSRELSKSSTNFPRLIQVE